MMLQHRNYTWETDEISNTLTSDTRILEFSSSEDTYKDVLIKIKTFSENTNSDIENISIFQEFLEQSEEFGIYKCESLHILKNVEILDTNLESWDEFIYFVYELQNTFNIKNLDLLMCKIYSDNNWKYVIDKIEDSLLTLNIRSSDDTTGHVIFEGDWTLESEDVDIDMIQLYFTIL